MFSTRISLFSRLFHFRRRRPAHANRTVASAPKPQRLLTPELDTARTAHARPVRRTHSSYHTPDLSTIAQSPPPSPLTSNAQDQEEPPLNLLHPPAPGPAGDFRRQPLPEDARFLEPSPTSKKSVKRCVSFQVVTLVSDTDSDTRDLPATPSSTHSFPSVPKKNTTHTQNSTLAREELRGQGLTEPWGEISRVAPFPEPPPAYDTLQSGSAAQPSASLLGTQSGSHSGRSRHLSLFHPQPARAEVSRFSLPARAKMPIQSRRMSVMPPARSNTAKKEKRASRWSREMNKPETQEVLRALSGF